MGEIYAVCIPRYGLAMNVTVHNPDELAAQLSAEGTGLERRACEPLDDLLRLSRRNLED